MKRTMAAAASAGQLSKSAQTRPVAIDFAVLDPTVGLAGPHIRENELRRTTCRALNAFTPIFSANTPTAWRRPR